MSRNGEPLDRARYAVTPTIAVDRRHPVVVGRPRLQLTYALAENRFWMGAVEPDVRLCPLRQIFRILAVVDDTEVIVRSPGVADRPSDDGQIVVSQFQR